MTITYTDKTKSNGTQIFENGDTYTGGFKDGKKHGRGILTSLNGRKYDGNWEAGVPHGPGIATFPNGKTYTGEYKHGRPYGHGTWTYKDGRTYDGVWEKGQFVNKVNQTESTEFRIATSLINFFVIGFLSLGVFWWVLKVFKIF